MSLLRRRRICNAPPLIPLHKPTNSSSSECFHPGTPQVVDKPALLLLSPTCLSELFRALIDNEITTQVRAVLCCAVWLHVHGQGELAGRVVSKRVTRGGLG